MATPELISSNRTWFVKYVGPYPTALGAAFLLAGPMVLRLAGAEGTWSISPTIRVALGLALTALAYWLFWFCRSLTRIELTNQYLLISDYRRTASVPLTAVSHITEHRWRQAHPIEIFFHTPTPWGDHVTFLPVMTNQWFAFSPHPVVKQLQTAVAVASGQNPTASSSLTSAWS